MWRKSDRGAQSRVRLHLNMFSSLCSPTIPSSFLTVSSHTSLASRALTHAVAPILPSLSSSPTSPPPVLALRLISGTCFFCNIVTISFSVRPQFRTWYRSLLLLLFSAVALLFYCCSSCCRCCCCCFLTCGSLVSSCFLYVKLPPPPCALATLCFCVKCLICLSSAERMQPLRKYVQPV